MFTLGVYGTINYSDYFPNSSPVVQSQSNGWTSPIAGNSKEIMTPEGCKKITSTQGSMMFIPTRTMAEWVSFRDHLPSGLVVSSCNMEASYSWNIAPNGQCSKSCGSGVMNIAVTCKRNDGVTVSDSMCISAKPGNNMSCNVIACRYANVGRPYNGSPSISKSNMLNSPIGFNGEYKIQDKDSYSYVTGNLPFEIDIPMGKKATFDYEYSYYSTELSSTQNKTGKINFTFNPIDNSLLWNGAYAGTQILTLGSAFTIFNLYQDLASNNHLASQLTIKVSKEPINGKIVFELVQFVDGYGEEYDYGHTRVDYARITNIQVQ